MFCFFLFEIRFWFLLAGALAPAVPPDTLPEWLRGPPAKRMCLARRGSNPLGVGPPGVLAQLEACVVSNDEVLGSKPRYSTLCPYVGLV